MARGPWRSRGHPSPHVKILPRVRDGFARHARCCPRSPSALLLLGEYRPTPPTRSSRIPWQEITAVLQEAFPGSQLAQIEPTKATAAVNERKKSVLRSEVLKSAGIPGDERERLSVLYPSKEFVRVPANECVTDAMLEAFVVSLTSTTPAPEVRPQVIRSPISARGAPRSQVVWSPILPPSALPPPGRLHAHPNPPTSPPPPSTTRIARRRLIVASTPPNATCSSLVRIKMPSAIIHLNFPNYLSTPATALWSLER